MSRKTREKHWFNRAQNRLQKARTCNVALVQISQRIFDTLYGFIRLVYS